MKGAEELGKILYDCSKQHDAVVEWYKQYQDDPVFTTIEGGKLREHLGGMIKQEALAMLMLGQIELIEALSSPYLDISKEAREAFEKALKED